MKMPIKVLIVEDDPMVVEITKEFMREERDFKVVGVANNGTDAVSLAAELKPDLVLLDNFLPCFNGTTIIEKVRAFSKDIDFIMITAAKEVPIVQECFRLGIRDYLIKPYLKQRFIQALQNYKQFYDTLNKEQICQADLDKLSIPSTEEEQTQKGFSQITEEKIVEFLKIGNPSGITAEDVAAEIGISVVSARRYLKLLQDKNIVTFDLEYGKQGRPTYLFSLKF